MTRTIVFVHGAWVTPDSWSPFRLPFEQAGFTIHAPTWPMLDGLTPAQVNRAPPEGFGGLTVGRIADHYQAFIETLPEAPVLIGHSFGGLLVQMLLDRGLGAAGVAINPAPIGGVIPGPISLAGALPVIARWNGWNRPYAHTRESFGRFFANTAPPALVADVFERFVIPAPGRIFYQAASWIGTGVKSRERRQPLLITGSEKDLLVSPYVSRAAYRLQRRSAARTDFAYFPGLSHLLIAEPGWEDVAGKTREWVESLS